MVKHIVFFKLKEEYSDSEKEKALSEISEILGELPKHISEIQYFEIVISQTKRIGGSDIGLISEFNSYEDLNKYREHPKHVQAVEIIKKHKLSSTFLDYVDTELIYKK